MSHTESDSNESSDSYENYESNKPPVIPEEMLKGKSVRIAVSKEEKRQFSYANAVKNGMECNDTPELKESKVEIEEIVKKKKKRKKNKKKTDDIKTVDDGIEVHKINGKVTHVEETVKLSEENCDTMKKHILQNILEEECAKIRQRMNVNQSAVTFEVKQFSRKTVLLENELFMGEDLLEDTVEKVCSDIAHKLCRQINNTLDPIYINTNVLNETRRIHCDHFSGNCCTTKSLDKIINRECLRILKQDFEFISYIIDFVAITEERLNIKCKIKDYEKKRSNLSVLSRKRMLKETKNVVYNLSGENCEKFNFLIEDLLLYDYSFNLNDELYDFLDIDMYTNILPMANWIYCLEEGKEMRSEYRHLLDSLSLARRSIIKTIIDCLYTFYELCDQDKIGLNFDCYKADYVEMCLYNNNIEDTLYDIICRSCAYNNVYFIPEFIALDYANGSNRIISRDVDVRYYIEYYVLWQAFDLMPSALASYENYSSSNLAKLQSKFEISSNNIRSKVINTKIDLAEPKAVVNKEIVIKKKIKKVELKKVPKLIEEPQLTCNSKKIENNEIDDWRQCAQYVLELLAKHKERNCDNNNNGKLGSFVGKLQNLESIKNCFLGIGAIVIVAAFIYRTRGVTPIAQPSGRFLDADFPSSLFDKVYEALI